MCDNYCDTVYCSVWMLTYTAYDPVLVHGVRQKKEEPYFLPPASAHDRLIPSPGPRQPHLLNQLQQSRPYDDESFLQYMLYLCQFHGWNSPTDCGWGTRVCSFFIFQSNVSCDVRAPQICRSRRKRSSVVGHRGGSTRVRSREKGMHRAPSGQARPATSRRLGSSHSRCRSSRPRQEPGGR